MKKKLIWMPILVMIILTGCSFFRGGATDVKVPILFSDNMVLQRDIKVPVWGTADAGGKIKIEINDQSKTAIVQKNGNWEVKLDKMDAGGPYELTIIGKDTLVFTNVMIGEVWLASGQSNMEMPLAGWGKILNYQKEIKNANYPNIRLFRARRARSTVPIDTINSSGWAVCNPNTIAEFSATAYFFGRHLSQKLDIPIGLVHSSWGGTVAEAWTSAEALITLPDIADKVLFIKSDMTNIDEALKEFRTEMKRRQKKIIESDAGYSNGNYIWNNQELELSGWERMKLPTLWEKVGYENLDGVVWFRKKISIPESMEGKELTLHLGTINDNDITWFNGTKVGGLNGANKLRKYQIPGSIVKTGTNVIAVRVFDMGNNGGLWGKPEQLKLEDNSGSKISLAGTWMYKIGFDLNMLSPRPQSPEDPNTPTVLYNAMIHPLIPFAIRGAIWYQGESNANRAFQYRTLFPTMIKDWRFHWNQGDFPFLFVQLANYMVSAPEPQEDAWAELREAQSMALSLPNTGMAVAIDIGEAEDIHPKNKQEVGRRLALNALNLVYDQKIEYSGPIYRSKTIEGSKIHLSFDHADSGFMTPGNKKIKGFAIAGADNFFYWAKAKIDSNSIQVWNDKIENPVAVRYAWASNPICNLYNKVGLPASPFRTDEWVGITNDKK